MTTSSLIAVLLVTFLSCAGFAQKPDIDKEMLAFAEMISAQVKESGRKKITVLDFSDLQGNTTELGRFLAEQVSIDLVDRRSGFSMMDRANLKTILAEHKLTVEGLTELGNAKKLGRFSGIDAIVLGTVTPLGDEIAVTAKIIATDTADIVGAAKARISKAKEFEHLMGSSVAGSPSARPGDKGSPEVPKLISQKFGDLNIIVERLRILGNQTVLINLVFKNVADSGSIAVAMYAKYYFPPAPLQSSLMASDGTEYSCRENEITGIRAMGVLSPKPDNLTEIPAGGEIKVSFKYKAESGPSDAVSSYRLQAEVVMDSTYSELSYRKGNGYYPKRDDGLPSKCKTHNLVLDIPIHKLN